MFKFSKNFKELFSFTRGERIGIAVLVIILAAVFAYPYFAPKPKIEQNEDFEKFKTQVDEFEASKSEIEEKKYFLEEEKNFETFDFDPNTASEETFVRLGFSAKQAASIIKYRGNGAKFKTADDFKKLYVVSDETFTRLKPFIKISKNAETINTSNTPEKSEKTFETFDFDPNTASEETFIRLGFSAKQAASIIKYRNSGATFKTADDFKKVYAVNDEIFERLKNNIKIEKNETQPTQKAEIKTYSNVIVNINTADTTELKKLRGIGSYYAQKIVKYRERLGGFANADQLREINGIDAERFDLFKNQAQINVDDIKKININSADEKTLGAHPYIGNYKAKAIIQYRNLSGKINNLQSLVKERILSLEQTNKLEPYISF